MSLDSSLPQPRGSLTHAARPPFTIRCRWGDAARCVSHRTPISTVLSYTRRYHQVWHRRRDVSMTDPCGRFPCDVTLNTGHRRAIAVCRRGSHTIAVDIPLRLSQPLTERLSMTAFTPPRQLDHQLGHQLACRVDTPADPMLGRLR